MNATTSSTWLRSWLSKPRITPLTGGLAALGLALGSAAWSARADETPWREAAAPPRLEPDVLPAELPISPLAPRADQPQPVSRIPAWQPRPNDGPVWVPGRPPTPSPVPSPAAKPARTNPEIPDFITGSEVEVCPPPRLVSHVEVEAKAEQPVAPTEMELPIPFESGLPLVDNLPVPPDKPLELPKTIPLANDDPEPKPQGKPPVKLAPPREMQPEKRPPVEGTTTRTGPPAPAANSVWGGMPLSGGEAPIHQVDHHHPPATVPNKHGTFGSPNLTLSRDRQVLDLFRPGFLLEEERSLLSNESPASDRSFVEAEYLLWWVNAGQIPVLAATGRGDQTFGYLGQPGTEVLLGPGQFGTTARNGFRTRVGTLWDTPAGERGLDGSFFFLGKRSSTTQFDSSQFPTISRPFFAPNFNSEFAQLVAFPGLSTGTLVVEQDSLLWGADANYRLAGCRTCNSHSEWFVGYRFLSLEESLGVTEFIVAGPQAPDPQGTAIIVTDGFETWNRFHGAQLGWAGGRQSGRWSWQARLSLAMGVTQQRLDISGDQLRQRPNERIETFSNGGLLAAGPNIGRFHRSRFSVVPEATFNLGYALSPRVRATVGYNVMYWSNILRPGEQIDRVIDLSFIPNGPPVPLVTQRPVPTFRQSDLWVQGIQFGLEARW